MSLSNGVSMELKSGHNTGVFNLYFPQDGKGRFSPCMIFWAVGWVTGVWCSAEDPGFDLFFSKSESQYLSYSDILFVNTSYLLSECCVIQYYNFKILVILTHYSLIQMENFAAIYGSHDLSKQCLCQHYMLNISVEPFFTFFPEFMC